MNLPSRQISDVTNKKGKIKYQAAITIKMLPLPTLKPLKILFDLVEPTTSSLKVQGIF
jgi:hypothetical protein